VWPPAPGVVVGTATFPGSEVKVGPDFTPVLTPAGELVGFPPPGAALETGFGPALAGYVATGAEAGGAPPTGATPQEPIGLLPGSLAIVPLITSLIGLTRLQEVDGSLSPPMRPGHLSIPASPASQLLMI
jgi:hypothetical protein